MPEPSLSVKGFQKILAEAIKRVAAEYNWDVSNSADRGYAFQRWLADVICTLEPGFDTEPEEACLYSKDLKADLVFEDTARTHMLICQSKYQRFEKSVDEAEVNDFFNRHEAFCNRSWVVAHGSPAASDALADYEERIKSGYSTTYYFFSTGKASPRVLELAAQSTKRYADQGIPVKCELFDFTGLKEYYVRSLSLEESAPSEIVLRLPIGRFIEKQKPHPTIVAVVKGNELRNLYKRYRESLYAWNIRGYLGNRGINREIYDTAQNRPGDFYYFNNGVSAICTNYDIRGENELHAENFQIINGAQTITTLAKSDPQQDLDVLLRLTRTANVKTEKGFNRDIIQFNNTQNTVRVSDFRSNDPIQVWLEGRFKTLKPSEVVPPIFYLRKRSVGRKGTGYGLRLEELAKIRYAFLVEPTLIHASPKGLWSLKEDEGVYEQAFGVDGELEAQWSDETFEQFLLALVFYLRIDEDTRKQAKMNPDLRFLRRLRFHALSLAGLFIREVEADLAVKSVLRKKGEFDSLFSRFWQLCAGVLEDVFSTAEEQNVTMFAFVRSNERWDQMRKRFRRRQSLTIPARSGN